MNPFERNTLLALLERNDFESADFFKQCEVKKQRVADQQSVEVMIEVPMEKYRILDRFAVQVENIEATLRINAEKSGEEVKAIAWTGKPAVLHYSNVKKMIGNRATIAGYRQISERQFLKADYSSAVITARKTVEMICADIIAKEDPGKNISGLPFTKLWLQAKKVVWNELERTVHEESIPNLKRSLDTAVKIGAGIQSSDSGLNVIKFKTVAATSSYIINLCFSTVYLLYDTVFSNTEEE